MNSAETNLAESEDATRKQRRQLEQHDAEIVAIIDRLDLLEAKVKDLEREIRVGRPPSFR